jgi:hypothetical protein
LSLRCRWGAARQSFFDLCISLDVSEPPRGIHDVRIERVLQIRFGLDSWFLILEKLVKALSSETLFAARSLPEATLPPSEHMTKARIATI